MSPLPNKIADQEKKQKSFASKCRTCPEKNRAQREQTQALQQRNKDMMQDQKEKIQRMQDIQRSKTNK